MEDKLDVGKKITFETPITKHFLHEGNAMGFNLYDDMYK